MKALIKQRGFTAVLVTHDQTEANAIADRIAVMEGGELQQYGTPETLRERPANLFVATFFGEPPMNVLAAEPAGDAVRLGEAAGETVLMPGITLPTGAQPAGGVALGIRPHRLALGEGAFRGTVTSNQWLGDQAHVVIDFRGRLLVAVSDRRVPARIGDTIAFGFVPRDVHIFDRTTGAALGHGLAAPWNTPRLGPPQPPDAALATLYAQLYPIYRDAYHALRPSWHRLAALREGISDA